MGLASGFLDLDCCFAATRVSRVSGPGLHLGRAGSFRERYFSLWMARSLEWSDRLTSLEPQGRSRFPVAVRFAPSSMGGDGLR